MYTQGKHLFIYAKTEINKPFLKKEVIKEVWQHMPIDGTFGRSRIQEYETETLSQKPPPPYKNLSTWDELGLLTISNLILGYTGSY